MSDTRTQTGGLCFSPDCARATQNINNLNNGFSGLRLIALLERRIPGRTGEFVFTKKDGSLLKEPPKSFKTAVDKLGFNKDRGPRDRITFHSLRHTAATFAARNHIDVKDMQLIFGWKTPSMVFRYVKGNESARRHAMKGLARTLSGEESKIVPIEKAEEVKAQ